MKRVKRRYLALKLEVEVLPTEKELVDTIWSAVGRLFGEFGASLTNLALISLDIERKIAIIRTSLETLDFVRASLASITFIAGHEASVHVLAVSGTIKSLFEKLYV